MLRSAKVFPFDSIGNAYITETIIEMQSIDIPTVNLGLWQGRVQKANL